MLNAQLSRASGGGDPDVLVDPRPLTRNEVELKLLAPAGVLAQLREAPVIARHARNGGVVRRLDAIYYDTQDRTLFSHGLSLRVRRNGKRYVQTLKRAPINGQPFVRSEWEASVDSVTPDLTLLPIAEIGAPLDALAPSALDPIFATKVHRRVQQLELKGAIVEVAFDEGSIEAGERSEPLTEIELEMKAGDAGVLYDLGLQLLEAAPLRIGTLSKADRGYDLAFGSAPASAKAKAPEIIAEHTVDDVLAILLGSCQHHLLANQAAAEDGHDTEGVHQMRVALRRLRTVFTLLRREVGSPTLEAFAGEAKWLAQMLAAPRDWDVFATDTLHAPAQALKSDVDFDCLRQAAVPHRVAAYTALREALADPRYNRFQLSLSRWIEYRGWRNELQDRPLAVLLEPAPALAERVLARLLRKALRQGAHFRQLQPQARHKLRITLKKLRYAAEFFHGLYAEKAATRRYVGCLSKLQNALGHDHDATTTRDFLGALARDRVTPEVQRTIGAVIGWQARDGIAVAKTVRKRWRRFKAMPAFWTS
jgi:inorganic triphosphatase YgiF